MARTAELPPFRVGAAHPQGPVAVVTRRASDRLRAGSVWVYRSEVEQVLPAPGRLDVDPGSLVSVLDGRGVPLGTALFSTASQITLRMVSAEAGLGRERFLAEVESRVRLAIALRRVLTPETAESNACRLIFSEADGLPGVIVDRYNDLLVLQLLTQGTAQEDLRALLVRVLAQELEPAAIVERPDPRIRIAEELPVVSSEPLFLRGGELKLATTFRLNGLVFGFDANAGQKTGAFLDQRENYAAAALGAHGRALDVCTYQGGFALHLARVCAQVTGVDASRAALEVADRNWEANRQLDPALTAAVDWIEADAFELLREFDANGERYDTIVLDPPAFAKTRRAAEGAARGYKELNLRALRMLNPGGRLVTCSCSHHVGLDEFTAIVAAAAADSGRRVQVIETRGAAPDHPAIVTLPETSYLKCLICRVD